MPAAIIGQVVKLTRGKPVNLGTIVAANTAVAWTVPEPTYFSQGFMIIQIPGTLGTTPTLEMSIDGGVTFMPIAPTGGFTLIAALTGDTAATAGFQFNVSGMGSGVLFKFGWAAGTPNTAVWVLVG